MRVVISGGGTGGGIYPALSVVDELVDDPRWETALEDILWVGQSGGLEERVMARRGIRFRPLPTGPLRGMSPWRAAAGLGRMAQGAVRGRRLLGEFGADVVLATGGYVSAPMLAAAWRRCPSLIYLPDMTPGLAVRYLSPLATRVAVSFDRALAHFSPGKAFVSGYPVRRALVAADRRGARAQLGFTDDASVVLVMGGSRGARAINAALAAGLPDLLAGATVIHVSGQADHDWLCRRRGSCPWPSASAIGCTPTCTTRCRRHWRRRTSRWPGRAPRRSPFPAVGLPAVLVPYPHSGAHQQPNADYRRAGRRGGVAGGRRGASGAHRPGPPGGRGAARGDGHRLAGAGPAAGGGDARRRPVGPGARRGGR